LNFLEEVGFMDESENTFPRDFVTDLATRPWRFRPEGYLVVILAGTEEAQRAETALVAEGFSPRDIKIYTGKQIRDNYEEYTGQRTLTGKVAGAVVDDSEARELYLGYAREDRCAMWVRIPNADDVAKAFRVLADFDYLHTRYYGDENQTDYQIS
jgi:hypothetical protein